MQSGRNLWTNLFFNLFIHVISKKKKNLLIHVYITQNPEQIENTIRFSTLEIYVEEADELSHL
jgi:hypothetical protein